MNDLWIDNIMVDKKCLKIKIAMTGEWGRYISKSEFICEYNVDISGVPDSLAVIPLLGNLLPIAWLHSLNIHVAVLDKSFYENLPLVLKGYVNMYPGLEFHDNLEVSELDNNEHHPYKNEACFFSGGVDAYYTFLRHRSEVSAIATVWGSDIALDDYEGWKNVDNATSEAARNYHVKRYLIKSNFREFINVENLTIDLAHPGWSWWHEFQHGIGLIALMAPVAYSEKLNRLYIASSYTADVKNLTCASDPSIDNYVRFNHCQVIHDGFEANRQQKIKYLVDCSKMYDMPIDLRVCWVSRGGKNCCVCEKCCRTMTALLLEDADPKAFGFSSDNSSSKIIARNMKYRNRGLARDWDILDHRFHEKYTPKNVPKEWEWFYKGGTDRINHNFIYSMKIRISWLLKKLK